MLIFLILDGVLSMILSTYPDNDKLYLVSVNITHSGAPQTSVELPADEQPPSLVYARASSS